MNHLVDAVCKVKLEELETAVRKEIIEHTELLKAVKGCHLYVLLPYPRPKYPWTKSILPMIHTTMTLGLGGAENVMVLKYLPVYDVDFDSDGIHINVQGCVKQFNHVMDEMKKQFTVRSGKRLADENVADICSQMKRASTSELSAEAMAGAGRGGRGRGGRGGRGASRFAKCDYRMTDNQDGDSGSAFAMELQDHKFELMAVWEAADVSTNKLNQNVLLLDLVPKMEKTEAIDVAKALVANVGLETQLIVPAFFGCRD
jgi:hypothetical protein